MSKKMYLSPVALVMQAPGPVPVLGSKTSDDEDFNSAKKFEFEFDEESDESNLWD